MRRVRGLRACPTGLRRLALHRPAVRVFRRGSAQGRQLDPDAAESARHQRAVDRLQTQTRSRFVFIVSVCSTLYPNLHDPESYGRISYLVVFFSIVFFFLLLPLFSSLRFSFSSPFCTICPENLENLSTSENYRIVRKTSRIR